MSIKDTREYQQVKIIFKAISLWLRGGAEWVSTVAVPAVKSTIDWMTRDGKPVRKKKGSGRSSSSKARARQAQGKGTKVGEFRVDGLISRHFDFGGFSATVDNRMDHPVDIFMHVDGAMEGVEESMELVNNSLKEMDNLLSKRWRP